MARTLHKLTDTQAKSQSLKPGRHSDGGGLYLNVTASGSRSWVLIWTRGGKKREMGMGSYPAVTLARARTLAERFRQQIAEGFDPIADKKKGNEPSFGECADMFLASMESQWRNDKHKAQWRMTLTTYCKHIRNKKVSQIGVDDVLKVLTPIWQEKHETASRLRGRIERVLDFARARGWREGENPAMWRGNLKSLLPARQKLTRGHHAAMPYGGIPAFMAQLRNVEAMSGRALELLVLTAARSGEVLGAHWTEIDFDAGIWIIPAKRMKAGKEHRVPLPGRALEILRPLYETRTGELVFPGYAKGKPLSNMAFSMLLRRMKIIGATVHGFRSAFRDWCGEETHFPRELAETALAHEIGNAVERAYRRGDSLEKRRTLLQAWADYCDGAGKVVSLRKVSG